MLRKPLESVVPSRKPVLDMSRKPAGCVVMLFRVRVSKKESLMHGRLVMLFLELSEAQGRRCQVSRERW
ncbi:unnamed protein product [Musa banksii]